jgi:hypothetical protein
MADGVKIGDAIPQDARVGQPIPSDATIGEPKKKSFNEQLTEVRPWPKYDPEHPIASAGRAVGTGLGNFGAGAIAGAEGTLGFAKDVMNPMMPMRELYEKDIKTIPAGLKNMWETTKAGHPEHVAGQLVGGGETGMALTAIPRAIGGAAGIPEAVGRFTRERPIMPDNPTMEIGPGKLKPWVNTTSRALGAGAGYLAGEGGLGPYGGYGGGALGYKLGPGLADMVLPRNPDVVGPFNKIPKRMPSVSESGGFSVERPQPQAGIPRAASTPGQELAARQAAIPRAPVEQPIPLRPLIGSEADWRAYEQKMGILRPEASDAGTYHAARGSVKSKANLQERIGKKIEK